MEVTSLTEVKLLLPPAKPHRFKRILGWEYLWLCLLVIVMLAGHFSLLYLPQYKTNDLIFDEAHYIKDARSILEGKGTTIPEHFSLGKLFILAGMKLFGDNAIGWRFFPILLGVAGIVFFYLICRRLNMPKTAAYLATFFLAFDNLTFVQSSVAMLDVFLLPFMMLSIWLYLRKNYLLSGVFIGLTTLVKFTGIMILPAIVLHWIFARRDGDWKFLGLMFLAPISFAALMPGFDYFIFGHLTNPIERVKTIFTLGSSLTFATAAHPSMSRPWDWLLKVDMMPFWYIPHYLATISLTIWFLIIPAIIYMVYRAVKGNDASHFALWWFFGTYLLWIPLSLLTNRISFVYYFFPTVGAICIGMGLAFNQLVETWRVSSSRGLKWTSMIVLVSYLLLHLTVFAVLSPLTNWWKYPVPPA